MPIEYRIENLPEFLYVPTSGTDVTLPDVASFTREVVKAIIKHDSRYVLCDIRKLQCSISMVDTEALADYASDFSLDHVKVVLVCSQQFMEMNSVHILVSANRKVAIRITENYLTAQRWLNKIENGFFKTRNVSFGKSHPKYLSYKV